MWPTERRGHSALFFVRYFVRVGAGSVNCVIGVLNGAIKWSMRQLKLPKRLDRRTSIEVPHTPPKNNNKQHIKNNINTYYLVELIILLYIPIYMLLFILLLYLLYSYIYYIIYSIIRFILYIYYYYIYTYYL